MKSNRLKIWLLGTMMMTSAACSTADDPTLDPARDDSFLAGMQGSAGKSDAILIEEGSPEALGILAVANELDFEALDDDVRLDRRAAESILVYRTGNVDDPDDDRAISDLEELDQIPWVGMRAFIKMYDYAKANGFIERFQQPVVECQADVDCGDGAYCHAGHCGDVTTSEPFDYSALSYVTDFSVASDGHWWMVMNVDNTDRHITGRGAEVVGDDSIEYADGELPSTDLLRLPDGQLTQLQHYGSDGRLVPEFGPELTVDVIGTITDAGYSADGTLYAVNNWTSVDDDGNDLTNYTIYRQSVLGWESDITFSEPYDDGQFVTASLRFSSDGVPQLLIDNHGTMRLVERQGRGDWSQRLEIDMVALGYSDRSYDRMVSPIAGRSGESFVHVDHFLGDERLPQLLIIGDDSFEARDDFADAPSQAHYTDDGVVFLNPYSGDLTTLSDGQTTTASSSFVRAMSEVTLLENGQLVGYETDWTANTVRVATLTLR